MEQTLPNQSSVESLNDSDSILTTQNNKRPIKALERRDTLFGRRRTLVKYDRHVELGK